MALPVVDSVLDGFNGTIFAYGQTGSGKTYTMSGGETWNERGIIPRTFEYLFDRLRSVAEIIEFNVYGSYVEIYNDAGYDLLERDQAEKPFDKWKKVSPFEDQAGNLHLKNLSIHTISNEQDALDLMLTGNFIRKVASTPMN